MKNTLNVSRRYFATVQQKSPHIKAIVNTSRYPLLSPHSKEYSELIHRCQKQLLEKSVTTLENFIHPEFIAKEAKAAEELSSSAFQSNLHHDIFLNRIEDPENEINQPPLGIQKTTVGSIANDRLSETSILQILHQAPEFSNFLSSILGKPIFPLADKLGGVTVNVFQPGWQHGLHFDEAEITTTLMLQKADSGGEFCYSARLQDEDTNFAKLEKLEREMKILDFDEGTLQLFMGRQSLHCVNKVKGKKTRLVAVFCFASEKGKTNSPHIQKMFWGRTK
eukprot:g855.t1